MRAAFFGGENSRRITLTSSYFLVGSAWVRPPSNERMHHGPGARTGGEEVDGGS